MVAYSPEKDLGCVAFATAFRAIGQAFQLQALFRCKEATEIYSSLPSNHSATSFVLCQMGICRYEMVDYKQACALFEQARTADPNRVEGLQWYSTALWHLKRENELSFLAQELTRLDKMCPDTWVAVGNCFSLQKEHETALKFFRRAIQLAPWQPYAYTLSAHEYFANEDFDKAISGYRNALGVDSRHYNAWYGMGTIYYRQEKHELAIYHFRRALSINARSSVLQCYLGMVLHASQRLPEALRVLEKADQLEPRNSLAKFEKANVYQSMQDYPSALRELGAVRDCAPTEAAVHFLMGKIYRKLNDPKAAMLCLIKAWDLDPKDKNLVKAAIDKLQASDAMQSGDDSSDEEL